MVAARVVAWRHGETDWNADGRYQGQADVPLNATGVRQAEVAADALAGLKPDRIVSSDLGRAVRTAEALASRTGLRVETEPRLREIHVGDWAGLTNDQVFDAHPDFREALYAGRDARRSPTGETGAEAGARVAEAMLDAALASPDGSTLVVVGHGFALRVAVVFLMGLDYAHNMVLGGLRNASWTVLQPSGEYWRLLSHNNVA